MQLSPPPVSPIIEGSLYQGDLSGYGVFAPGALDLHVACPEDFPPNPDSAKEVLFIPLVDDPGVNWSKKTEWCRQVANVAKRVAREVQDGNVVLVSCVAGLNRSGMVNALALCRLLFTPNDAINAIREMRPGSLFNDQFVRVIRRVGPRIRSRR